MAPVWLTLDQAARLVHRPAWMVRSAVLMDEVVYTLTDDERSYLVLESSLRRRFRIRPRRPPQRDWGVFIATAIVGAAFYASWQTPV